MIFYLIDKLFKIDYVSVLIQQPINSQNYMLISSNLMISVLHNSMRSIGKNVSHTPSGKNGTAIGPWCAKMLNHFLVFANTNFSRTNSN